MQFLTVLTTHGVIPLAFECAPAICLGIQFGAPRMQDAAQHLIVKIHIYARLGRDAGSRHFEFLGPGKRERRPELLLREA